MEQSEGGRRADGPPAGGVCCGEPARLGQGVQCPGALGRCRKGAGSAHLSGAGWGGTSLRTHPAGSPPFSAARPLPVLEAGSERSVPTGTWGNTRAFLACAPNSGSCAPLQCWGPWVLCAADLLSFWSLLWVWGCCYCSCTGWFRVALPRGSWTTRHPFAPSR